MTGADCQPCRITGIFERRNRIAEQMRIRRAAECRPRGETGGQPARPHLGLKSYLLLADGIRQRVSAMALPGNGSRSVRHQIT